MHGLCKTMDTSPHIYADVAHQQNLHCHTYT